MVDRRSVLEAVAAGALVVVVALVVGCQTDAAVSPSVTEWVEPAFVECPAGEWSRDEQCVEAEQAFAAPGGTTYVVDQEHASASDAGPGTTNEPWLTISRAARRGALRPGDAVLIRAGVYREAIRPESGGSGPTNRVTFAAYPGDRVIVSGADVATNWQPLSDGSWRSLWTGPSLETYSDDLAFRREMVLEDGFPLRAVSSRSVLEVGQFKAEGPPASPGALVARFADRPVGIEVGMRERLFWPTGPDPYAECGDPASPGWLRVVGITFRHASNRAQWGTFCAGSQGGLVEDVTVEWTVGLGIDISGRNHTFRRVRADLNGQMGWGGGCTGCVLEDGAAVGNNWVGHDPFWEAGGMKLVRTSDTMIRRHYAAHNGGPGVWLDGDNHRNTIEYSLMVSNQVAGVMLELETTETLVQHNVIAQTRWQAWSGSGVLSQAARRNALMHNTIVANEGAGVWLRLDPDRRAPDGENEVWANVIAGNVTSRQEAREMSVEGTTLDHVRSNRFGDNRYGYLPASLEQSTFFLYPVPGAEAGFRGSDIETWQRLTLGDQRGSVERDLEAGAGPRPRVPDLEVGAPSTRVVPFDQAGAHLDLVRARGRWREAPPAPSWPR